MKNKGTIILIVVFVILTGYLLTIGAKEDVFPVGSKLPEISYLNENQELINVKTNNSKLFLMYFGSECSFCNYELELIDKNLDLFENIRFLFLTSEKDYFKKEHKNQFKNLNKETRVAFGKVDKNKFTEKFGKSAKPSIFIFDKNGILKAKQTGETKLKKLIELIKRSDDPELRAN